MPDSDSDKTFDELDLLIIAGRALGMTQVSVGDWVRTPTFPGGVSEKTVRNRTMAQKPTFDRLIMYIAAAFQRRQQEFEDLTKRQYLDRLEKLRGKRFRVKELALDQGIANPSDVESLTLANKVAESLDNRDLGMAKMVHQVGGSVDHRLFFDPQPIRTLAGQEVDMLNSARLLAALPADVLDAEVIETP